MKGDAVPRRAHSDERCHKAREVLLALIGAKRGGKGSITRIMQALVGKAHHASVMLNDLAGDFGLAGLTDKRAIFIPDAHDADLFRRSAAIERIAHIVLSPVYPSPYLRRCDT